eukprot:CAMPEP_0179008612 /NCGR_PEP_ID=MMETSP0795-20121207/15815_1 /TAXON_ID=88552 /ORGANISM="Amoebophrya sp., Strain Ameob2" /LENGTH=331 /DNA_ID=CAMNT_0020703721 /DNA_START=75 /DNA_END=1070 /DNA_ORIENTATION=-
MTAECALLGEQWVKYGPQVAKYVKRLQNEKQKLLAVQESWNVEREEWRARVDLQRQGFEEAVLKCWQLANQVGDLEKDAAGFQMEKLRLVNKLDAEKAEFCDHEQKRRDDRIASLREENARLQAAVQAREATIAEQQQEMEKLQAQVADADSARSRVEDTGRRLVADLEEQVCARTEAYKTLSLGLLVALVDTSAQVLSEEDLEEIVGKCPLEEKSDEEFNSLLDVCCEEYSRYRLNAPRKVRNVLVESLGTAIKDRFVEAAGAAGDTTLDFTQLAGGFLEEHVWKPKKLLKGAVGKELLGGGGGGGTNPTIMGGLLSAKDLLLFTQMLMK